MFILMGEHGERAIIAPRSIEAAEEIPMTKDSEGGVRVFLSGGHELEIWGVRMDQFWEEVKTHFNSLSH